MNYKTIGILGGGQLGRMTALAAAPLDLKVICLTPESSSPTTGICQNIIADCSDYNALDKFADLVDIISYESENIPLTTAEYLSDKKPIAPSIEVLKICQNRLREKTFINNIGIKTADFIDIKSLADLQNGVAQFGGKAILKTAEQGYDGKGQVKINAPNECEAAYNKLADNKLILESIVVFEKEISVIVARNKSGDTACYEPVENIHENHILRQTIAPAQISDDLSKKAKQIAIKIADEIGLIGLIAVEMFVCGDDLLVNELAPRPHNSGHYTIDACITSQFEQFLRAITNLPLGNTAQHSKAEMINILGDEIHDIEQHLNQPNTKTHTYAKREARVGRKMGHVVKLG